MSQSPGSSSNPSKSTTSGESASTSDDEWARVAEAVERRRTQNRIAQRKHRVTLRQRAMELEKRNAQKAACKSTPPPGASSSRSLDPANHQSGALEEGDPDGLGAFVDTRPLGSPAHRGPSPWEVHHDDNFSSSRRHNNAMYQALTLSGPVFESYPADHTLNHLDWSLDQPIRDPIPGAQELLGIQMPETMAYPTDILMAASHSDLSTAFNLSSEDGSLSDSSCPTPSQLGYSPERPALLKRSSVEPLCGKTPLHLAAARGDHSMTQLLLQSGYDPTAKDGHGWTPLHLAVDHGHEEVVKVLLENCKDLHAAMDGPNGTNRRPCSCEEAHQCNNCTCQMGYGKIDKLLCFGQVRYSGDTSSQNCGGGKHHPNTGISLDLEEINPGARDLY
ncbi:hypothetical protein F5884DRAFT_854143 [Xylogone sp. PMI_703]|nr:hypothetical protein F5884DRAFT_854143 [Xylogone sp. PMI_703]